MIKNKLFIKYIALSTSYICLISLFLSYIGDKHSWFSDWFSDGLFVFQTVIIYLLGCSVINEQYGYSAYHRHNNKKSFVCNHIADYFILSFIITAILFVSITVFVVIHCYTITFDLLVVFLNNFIKNFLGLCLVGIVSLNFLYSNFNRLKNSSLIITYLVLILEVKVINSKSSSFLGFTFYILFSWFFFFNDLVSYVVMLFYIMLFLLILLRRIKKVDLIK